jgi:hypothetical protein
MTNGGKQAIARPSLELRAKAETLRDSVPPNSVAATLAQNQIDFIDEQLRRLDGTILASQAGETE